MRPAGPAAPRGSRADAVCPVQIQDLAIRCVQKNIKKNKGVKDWPWWKLFTTVRPLIEVQLTEDQIRGKDVGTAAPGGWGWGRMGLGVRWRRAGTLSGVSCGIPQRVGCGVTAAPCPPARIAP